MCGLVCLFSVLADHDRQTSFFQNEEIFVKLDELDEFYRISQAWIGSNFSPTQAQETL